MCKQRILKSESIKWKLEFSPSGLRRYASNTAWLLADKIVRLSLALLVSILLARTLGPSTYGTLQYAQSFVGLFSLLTTYGMDSIIVRDIVRRPNESGLILGSAIGIRALLSLINIFLIAISVRMLEQDELITKVIIIVSLGSLLSPLQTIEYYFHANVVAWRSSIAYLLSTAAGAAWIVAGLAGNKEIVFYSAQNLIESAILTIGLYVGFLIATRHAEVKVKFSSARAVLFIRECWPLALSLGLVSVYANIDKIMVRTLLSDEATGIYSIAAKLSEAWYFIPTVIVNSVFPAVVRARETSGPHFRKRIQNLYSLVTWLSIAVALTVTMVSEFIIVMLYGETYKPAAAILTVHVWAGVLVSLGIASGRWYILEGFTKAYMARTLIGVVSNIGFNFLLIPQYGTMGAAWSTLISQIFVVIIFDALWAPARENCIWKLRALLPFIIR